MAHFRQSPRWQWSLRSITELNYFLPRAQPLRIRNDATIHRHHRHMVPYWLGIAPTTRSRCVESCSARSYLWCPVGGSADRRDRCGQGRPGRGLYVGPGYPCMVSTRVSSNTSARRAGTSPRPANRCCRPYGGVTGDGGRPARHLPRRARDGRRLRPR